MVDLGKLDTYEEGKVPDEDVEIALKVIRTLRDCHLDIADFGKSVLLSEAHKAIVEAVQECQ